MFYFCALGGEFGGGGSHGGPGGQEIPILAYSNENIGDGNYQFNYETGNGISVQESGHQQGRRLRISIFFLFIIIL